MLSLDDVCRRLEAKPSAYADRPFGPGVVVYKIAGKMFAIVGEANVHLTL
jgi:predicted DNA-binding protein (MmcQ/YjbR family)